MPSGRLARCSLTSVPTICVTNQLWRRWYWIESEGGQLSSRMAGPAMWDSLNLVMFLTVAMFLVLKHCVSCCETLMFSFQVWTTNTWLSTTASILRILSLGYIQMELRAGKVYEWLCVSLLFSICHCYIFTCLQTNIFFSSKVVLHQKIPTQKWCIWSWIVSIFKVCLWKCREYNVFLFTATSLSTFGEKRWGGRGVISSLLSWNWLQKCRRNKCQKTIILRLDILSGINLCFLF